MWKPHEHIRWKGKQRQDCLGSPEAPVPRRGRDKPGTKESGATGQARGRGGGVEEGQCRACVGFRAQEPGCPSGTVPQVLEVHGHVRNHSRPTEVDLIGLGNRSAIQGKSKKVKGSQNNES